MPPTSIATGWQFLELMDLYANGRQFFDDDPTTTLEQFGLTESDFTSRSRGTSIPTSAACWTSGMRPAAT